MSPLVLFCFLFLIFDLFLSCDSILPGLCRTGHCHCTGRFEQTILFREKSENVCEALRLVLLLSAVCHHAACCKQSG